MNYKHFLLLPVLALSLAAQAQKQGFGIHLGAYDFYGPQTNNYLFVDKERIRFNGPNGAADTSIRNRILWTPMVKLSYWFQISRHVDISLGLSLANLQHPLGKTDSAYINLERYDIGSRAEKFLTELDARFQYNILPKEEYIAAPYLFAGVNGSYHDIFLGADIPLGIGINFNLSKQHNIFFNLESAYKVAATDHDVNHLQHTAGLVYWFKPGYRVPKAASPATVLATIPKDSDGDGVEDAEDQCPTIAGMAQFSGCPDSDGDGISDKEDACPLVAGLAQLGGCPDTDSDGIPDNKDKCPYVAGTADREGCPVPDRDNDGFADDLDRCPDVYSKTNGGCPEIRKEIITQVEKAAKAIFFETGKATIKKISFKSLDAVAAILKGDATLYADVEGHTDNVQPKTYSNMELSQKRADAVRAYFISKGVGDDRITAQGFGDTQPVADNGTAAGKAQNRRTVIKLRNFRK